MISVAAGDKNRALADFSSRGTPGGGGQFTLDGTTWTWRTADADGAGRVDHLDARDLADRRARHPRRRASGLEPAYLPYYTTLSGTSMAAPHVAGIVALLLDANPALTPLQIKAILQPTATPIPYATWEAGAGYVNA